MSLVLDQVSPEGDGKQCPALDLLKPDDGLESLQAAETGK